MDEDLFEELLEGVQEMDAIAKGKKEPSRRRVRREPEVQAIRERTGLS